jgi:cytochrome P450
MKSPDFMMAGEEERTIFLEDTLIMAEGQRHSELKQLFSPLMSRQALAYYELHLVEPVIQEAIAEMQTRRGPDGLVRTDVVPLIQATLTRISARLTGVDGVDTPERTERFRDLVLTLSAATTGSFSTTPDELIQAGRNAMSALIDEYLRASLDRRIDLVRRHRAGEIDKEDLPRDMLTALCLQDDLSHPDDAEKIPYVWRQCALFLTGSIKTTTHSLPHVFVHLDEWLHEHPEDRESSPTPSSCIGSPPNPSGCTRPLPRASVPRPATSPCRPAARSRRVQWWRCTRLRRTCRPRSSERTRATSIPTGRRRRECSPGG